MNLWQFLAEYDHSLLLALEEHMRLVAVSLAIAAAIGIPAGIWVAQRKAMSGLILTFANVVQTLPSIALFGLMIPVLSLVHRGIGMVPATIALVLYAQLPIIQ